MTKSVVVTAYRQKTPGSKRLAHAARALFPNGVTHDARILDPRGFGGHAALLLGRNYPDVAGATARALAAGTQHGANHPADMRWAQAVQRMARAAGERAA